jgi:hypothetical protein
MGEDFDKYYKKNPFPPTQKHYLRAFIEVSRQGRPPQESVPDDQVELDKYGRPLLQEGQVIALRGNRPGRS